MNYEGFELDPEIEGAYVDMVKDVVEKHYNRVTRFTTGTFMHAKLGIALAQRGLSAHIFETETEARAHLAKLSGK